MAWAVVVAGGRGTRAGFDRNKVFMPLAGTTVLTRTLHALTKSNAFEGIVLVLSESDISQYKSIAESEWRCPLVSVIATGGTTRAESVYNGLLKVPDNVEYVAIHDAARPFVSTETIRACLRSAQKYGSGVASTPVTDTIKIVDHDLAIGTPDRSTLRAVQTPQCFRRNVILSAYQQSFKEGYMPTDDASVYARYIGPVQLVYVPGGESNRKLTIRDDFMQAEKMLQIPRIGIGYDAHRLVEGRKLILCGVTIPFEKGLLGHSDADVAVHALMDAMLGASALGDIGILYPDNDPAYEGISSILLLQKTERYLKENHFHICNADITIIAQRPKLLPYRDAMRENIANAINVSENMINVKATTTEHMGFEGAGEGISANAIVMLTQDQGL